MDSEPIFKKTLVTMAAMVGACVLFVGSLSTIAVVVTSHAVNPSGTTDTATEKSEPSRSGSGPMTPAGKPTSASKSAQQI